MRLDPSMGETRRDVGVAAGVLCDPMDEEQMRAYRAGRRPAQGAELEAVPRSSEPDDAVPPLHHGVTICGCPARVLVPTGGAPGLISPSLARSFTPTLTASQTHEVRSRAEQERKPAARRGRKASGN